MSGSKERGTRMPRRVYAAIAFAVYAGAIVLSNYLIVHVGTPTPYGTHTTPVWPGLTAPSGVWVAALSFPARDILQRLTPTWDLRLPLPRGKALKMTVPAVGLIAILIGAGISYLISSPVIAIASGLTYLCSETADFAVYTPLQRRWFVPAVFASGCVAIVVDSVLFLHLAGIYSLPSLEGLILGKFWVILAAVPVTWLLRNRGPVALAPEVSPA
jgi:uncharacterized PurR-regulated membrane protein YhhQ (DUF165 family)